MPCAHHFSSVEHGEGDIRGCVLCLCALAQVRQPGGLQKPGGGSQGGLGRAHPHCQRDGAVRGQLCASGWSSHRVGRGEIELGNGRGKPHKWKICHKSSGLPNVKSIRAAK